jgi:hypothetical protein
MSAWDPSVRPTSASDAGKSGASSTQLDLVSLLQVQKRAHVLIAKNPLFREYNSEAKRKMVKLRRKGWKDAPKPQIDDDLDAEAMQRVMHLVSAAAADGNKSLTGVWARFGKSYQPLGVMHEVRRSGLHAAVV